MSHPVQIGAYVLEGELARGGMGVVFVARDTRMDRRVALKLMQSPGANRVRRFAQEAALVARLQHPNVVKVHDVGTTPEGQPWFAMELVEGESLEAKLGREGPLAPRPAAAIAEALAQALQHAHERDVIHRDVKPGNVLVTRDGRALLTDFGLARELSEERERLTRTGVMLGTPGFMPPEQAAGQREIGVEADVYGLGATLYAMLTGRPPFVGATLMALMAEIEHHQPLPPSKHSPGLDRALDAIVLKCLAKEPSQRYGSAARLAEDLARYQRGESVEARAPRAPRDRQRLLLLGLAGVALLSVGLSAFLLLREPPAPATATPSATPTPSRTAPAPAGPSFLARWQELEGAAFQKAARRWLPEHRQHPLAAKVRLRYLRQGLLHPRESIHLSKPEQILALGGQRALALRSGLRLDLRPRSKRPTSPLGGLGGKRYPRVYDRARGRVLTGAGPDVWGVKVDDDLRRSPVIGLPGGRVDDLAITHAGDLLAVLIGNQRVHLYELPSERLARTLELGGERVQTMRFTHDGSELIVVRKKKYVETWGVKTGKRLTQRSMIATPTCLAMHPRDPKLFAAGFPLTNQVVLFQLRPFKPAGEMFGDGLRITTPLITDQPAAHATRPNAVAFHPSGRWLLSAAGDPTGTQPGELRVWDVDSQKQVAFVEHRRGLLSIDVTPDGTRLLSVSNTGKGEFVVDVWEVGAPGGSP